MSRATSNYIRNLSKSGGGGGYNNNANRNKSQNKNAGASSSKTAGAKEKFEKIDPEHPPAKATPIEKFIFYASKLLPSRDVDGLVVLLVKNVEVVVAASGKMEYSTLQTTLVALNLASHGFRQDLVKYIVEYLGQASQLIDSFFAFYEKFLESSMASAGSKRKFHRCLQSVTSLAKVSDRKVPKSLLDKEEWEEYEPPELENIFRGVPEKFKTYSKSFSTLDIFDQISFWDV